MNARYTYFLTGILLLFSADLCAQPVNWTWKTLSYPPAERRYNDIFFVTPLIGWTIHPYDIPGVDSNYHLGRIYKTTDGGDSWTIQLDSSHNHFRCMGFADSLHGWVFSVGGFKNADSLGIDTTLIFETSDGGMSWFTPQNNIEGPRPRGLCGMSVVNREVAYASGRVGGPCYVMKTTNSGKTWKSIDMNSYAASLIDCHFWSPDSGIVVGGTNIVDTLCSALILFTSDGGNSWSEVYRGDSLKELCWKISFPSQNTGYVSIQNYRTARSSLLKTIDHGQSWNRILLPSFSSWLQGVGFINDTLGWTGGWFYQGWQTKNGGKNWSQPYIGLNLNRFRFFGDSLGYCSGKSIYKLTFKKTSKVEVEPSVFLSSTNYPNPFDHRTTIHFSLQHPQHISLKVYSALGEELHTLIDGWRTAGDHVIPFIPDNGIPSSGTYFYILRAGLSEIKREMIRLN